MMTLGINESENIKAPLPDGWKTIPLSNFPIEYGDGLTKRNRGGGSIPVYGSNGIVGWHTTALTNGPTIIIGRKGSVGAVHLSTVPCWPIDTTYYIDEFPNDFDHKFLYYFLRTQTISDLDTSTAIPGINRNDLGKITVPQPPLDEQRRIVAKLEAVLAQTRTARVALERIPALLKVFRQSVLAAAFRGELTERDPNDEPASVLLERIRAERRRRWEEDLRAKGKDPARAVYEEPLAPDISKLPELPEGWVWTTLQMIADVRSGVTKGRDLSKFKTIEVPYLRVANVQAGYLDLREVKRISIKEDELYGYRLQVNDVLYTEGGDRDKLGRGTVWKGEVDPCIHQNHIFCARLYLPDVNPEWVSMTGQLEYARNYVDSVASQSVNLASINSTNLKAMPVPLPPKEEQLRIMEKVTALMHRVQVAEQAFVTASNQTSNLEQQILIKSFRGDL
mgnify:FL=1